MVLRLKARAAPISARIPTTNAGIRYAAWIGAGEAAGAAAGSAAGTATDSFTGATSAAAVISAD